MRHAYAELITTASVNKLQTGITEIKITSSNKKLFLTCKL